MALFQPTLGTVLHFFSCNFHELKLDSKIYLPMKGRGVAESKGAESDLHRWTDFSQTVPHYIVACFVKFLIPTKGTISRNVSHMNDWWFLTFVFIRAHKLQCLNRELHRRTENKMEIHSSHLMVLRSLYECLSFFRVSL